MIPITRKEKYINEIVGGGDTAPKTPQTREEFFFAEILGEVIAPSPVTRVEKYLSAIAEQYSGDLPTPITRIEYFLARAAGMEIETPIPITREEMLWDTYIPIKIIEGIPPLTFKAKKAGTLKNYRIYGQTVDGESVGDRTGNILPMSTTPIDTIIDDFHCEYDGMGIIKLTALTDNAVLSGFTVPLSKDFTIPVSIGQGGTGCWQMHNDAAYMNVNGSPSFILELMDNTDIRDYWRLLDINKWDCTYVAMGGTNINSIKIRTIAGVATNIQSGQTLTISPAFVENVTVPVPFEPYGYKVPVTVSNDTDTLTTPIYLPEQIKKVGDEAEYISYADQKLHRVGADDIDVTLPALPTLTGTNVLSVGTAVQPSKVYVKYKGEHQ